MWLHRSPKTLEPLIHFRPLYQAATTGLSNEEFFADHSTPLEYLEGFPRPDPKHNETILEIPGAKSGKNIAAKERKVGRAASINFEQENGQEGGNKRLIFVQDEADTEAR